MIERVLAYQCDECEFECMSEKLYNRHKEEHRQKELLNIKPI